MVLIKQMIVADKKMISIFKSQAKLDLNKEEGYLFAAKLKK